MSIVKNPALINDLRSLIEHTVAAAAAAAAADDDDDDDVRVSVATVTMMFRCSVMSLLSTALDT